MGNWSLKNGPNYVSFLAKSCNGTLESDARATKQLKLLAYPSLPLQTFYTLSSLHALQALITFVIFASENDAKTLIAQKSHP